MIRQTTYEIPVVLQDLPDLKYDDGDWTSENGRQIAIGSISTAILAQLYEVDRLTPDNKAGYQRQPIRSRVNSLKRDLEAGRVDLPTAVLLNFREYEDNEHLSKADGTPHLILRANEKLYLVDGQHRIEALVSLYEDAPEKWANYSVPFVCLLGSDRDGEMTEFFVVNYNAKSIGTSLAYELLKRRAESSEEVSNHLIETGKLWLRTAGSLTDRLAETEIWRSRIQFPGDPRKGTLITNNGMTNSLRPLVEQPGYFQSIADERQQIRVLIAYWEGIKQIVPEVMAEPEAYNLQRTLGVSALHAVLVNVLAIMGSRGLSVLEPSKYAEIISKSLNELGGTNKQGEYVVGTDFWKRGADGASGLFSNRAGYRILQAQIIEKLPPITVH
ncbi:MAG: DGQHR domain-containing protein [Chloroflexota bacterium]|nr:DGQHR domain-containing protein [Chloroflexota bacterium]